MTGRVCTMRRRCCSRGYAPATSAPAAPGGGAGQRGRQRRRGSAVNCRASSSGGDGRPRMGLLLVDHGSKKAAANEMLESARDMLAARAGGDVLVEAAHMEIASPSIEDGIVKLAGRGLDLIVVAPFFLSPGRHVTQDIPQLVREAEERVNADGSRERPLEVRIADPIGLHPMVADIIMDRVGAATTS